MRPVRDVSGGSTSFKDQGVSPDSKPAPRGLINRGNVTSGINKTPKPGKTTSVLPGSSASPSNGTKDTFSGAVANPASGTSKPPTVGMGSQADRGISIRQFPIKGRRR